MTIDIVLLVLAGIALIFKPESIINSDAMAKVFVLLIIGIVYTSLISMAHLEARLTQSLLAFGYLFDAIALFYFGQALMKRKV